MLTGAGPDYGWASMKGGVRTWQELLADTRFPVSAWMNVSDAMSSWNREPSVWGEWAGAWNAVAYRWRACWDASESFEGSVVKDGDAPEQGVRYQQERKAFEFFVSSLSVLESHSYALHAIGAMLRPAGFPLTTEAHRRSVTLKSTVQRFEEHFPHDPLTEALRRTSVAKELADLTLLRNTLAHRTQPGRTIVVGGTSTWQGRPLSGATTPTLDWLQEEIGILAPLTAAFIEGQPR